MERGSGFASATVALRHREYRIFWIAALISNTGGWMQNAAIPFVVFELTGRNAGVGIAGFWSYAPIMVMGAWGGSLADRFDKPAAGLQGGGDGSRASCEVLRGNERIPYRSMGSDVLRAGDLLVVRTGGGGGYGTP